MGSKRSGRREFLKGSAAFLHVDEVRDLAHEGEGLLAEARSGAMPLTPEIAGQLLNVADGIRQRVESLFAASTPEDARDSTATGTVGRAGLPRMPTAETPSASTPSPPLPAASEQRSVLPSAPTPPRPLSPSKIIAVESLPPPASSAEPVRGSVAISKSSGFRVEGIRVDVQLLDRLMNLVGELVLLLLELDETFTSTSLDPPAPPLPTPPAPPLPTPPAPPAPPSPPVAVAPITVMLVTLPLLVAVALPPCELLLLEF